MLPDQFCQCSKRILFAAKRVISQALNRQLSPLALFSFSRSERLLWHSLCNENQGAREVPKCGPWVQIQRFLQVCLSLLVSACEILQKCQVQERIGTKRVKRDHLFAELDGLLKVA